ncbi:MAG: SRPBCC domain-containing protein [Candidatus Sulfotelmatobacter sp.]
MSERIMSTTRITEDRDAVVSEIEIAAPPERVFRALTTREQALQWGTSDAFEMTLWEMDARPGGKWRFVSHERTGPGAGKDYDHHGEIVEFDPPRVLAYSWFANWHPDPSHATNVRWELTPTKTGTHLVVTHSGLAALPGACEGYSQGWPGLVDQLKKFAERSQ